MKKVLILAMTLVLMSGVCAASPLTDYSQGKAAIDIDFYPSGDMDLNGKGFDGKSSNMAGSVTVGIGNDFAVQYRQSDWEASLAPYKAKINTQQFNLLYKVNKNVSAFAGFSKTSLGRLVEDGELKGPNQTDWQVGLIGSKQIAKKTTAYALAAMGSDIRNWEVGVSYAFAKNVEFNVMYRDFRADNLAWGGHSVDAEVKGIGYGLTFKF